MLLAFSVLVASALPICHVISASLWATCPHAVHSLMGAVLCVCTHSMAGVRGQSRLPTFDQATYHFPGVEPHGCREDGTHALTYELGWRSVFDHTRLASHAVAAQTGHQLKSALRYTYHWDTFDNSLMPSEGWGGR